MEFFCYLLSSPWNHMHILTFFCLLSLPLIALRVPIVSGDAMTPETCTTAPSSTCQAMVGYVPSANVQLSRIASLFSLNYTSLLGPNDFNLSLQGLNSVVVPANKVYKIPQTCGCLSGKRVVTSTNYTVQPGDTLSLIAQNYYSNLVTYQEIAAANGVTNVNMIYPDQNFTIPIPCACFNGSDEGRPSVFLSYQIQTGDILSDISATYNTTVSDLELLNGLSNDTLTATSVLFVPLPVCKANFSTNALDKNLTVVEGTYELTANNCVQCSCSNGTLHCIPTPSSIGTSCSKMTCSSSNLTLGAFNASQGSNGCSVQSCVYMGYTTKSGIISKLENEVDPTCPAPPPPETVYNPPQGLVSSPLASPTNPSPSQPQSPPSPIPSTPSPSTNPNSASLIVGSALFSWRWLLVLGLCLWVPLLAL